MEYAEKGSLADALRTGRLRKPNGLPDLSMVLSCLTDIASGGSPDGSTQVLLAMQFNLRNKQL